MLPLSSDQAVVFQDASRAACEERGLVLAAAGIATQRLRRNGLWLLVVSSSEQVRANEELAEYERENSDSGARERSVEPVYDYAATGALLYMVVIAVVGTFSVQQAFGIDWLEAGRMEAGRVTAGQWQRVATALTLHLDAMHLAGNLAFGGVLGYLVGRTFGGGVGWLAILLAGASGNAVNAVVQDARHASIGASTAVFAALGILAARYSRPWSGADERPLKRYSPLIGGVVLLTFTGFSGERTDVVAHLAGFLTGMLVGWAARRLPPPLLANRRVQQAAGMMCLALLVAAWMLAIG